MYSSAVSRWMCGLLFSVMVGVLLAQQPCTDQLDNVPYITFIGERLPNNAFVNIQQISDAVDTSTLQCHTDLSECCSPSQHSHTGMWVLPNGAEVMHGQTVFGYTAIGTERRIDLTYNTLLNSPVEGVFKCTVSVFGTPTVQQSVYVGIHSDNSELVIEDSVVNIPSNFDHESPQFSVSCTSSGGPVGCVQWLKDGVPIATPQTTSTLIGPEEGRYVPVLTVNDHENAAGTYVCNISNNKPDAVSDSVDVHVPGVPILRLYSVTSDAVSISWTVPAGSVVDSYDVQWQVHFETRSTFHVTLSPTSFNNYTVTGLESYSNNVTLSIAVIAYNAAGNETSPSVNVAVGFVNQESSKGNNAAIVGAVVGGCVVLAIAVVTVVLLIYHYWSRDKRNTQAQSPVQENGPHVPVETVIFYNARSPVGTGKRPLPTPVPRADDDVMNDGYDVIDDGL